MRSRFANALAWAALSALAGTGSAQALTRAAVQVSANVVDACQVSTAASSVSQVQQRCTGRTSGSVQLAMRPSASLASKGKTQRRLVARPGSNGRIMLVTVSY
jgi:hypothetical protein